MNANVKTMSETQRLANYLIGLGYPLLNVEDESGQDAGHITIIDTNPSNIKGQERAVLGVQVIPVTRGRGAKKRTELECLIYADRWYKNGRRAIESTYACDDLSNLGDDVDTQESIARMVHEDLKLIRSEKVFDAEYLGRVSMVRFARQELRDAEAALQGYLQKRSNGKVVPIKR